LYPTGLTADRLFLPWGILGVELKLSYCGIGLGCCSTSASARARWRMRCSRLADCVGRAEKLGGEGGASYDAPTRVWWGLGLSPGPPPRLHHTFISTWKHLEASSLLFQLLLVPPKIKLGLSPSFLKAANKTPELSSSVSRNCLNYVPVLTTSQAAKVKEHYLCNLVIRATINVWLCYVSISWASDLG
jgi:hypothetical protein